ncbi:bifunctional farnesyl-diphosphate farnesyltransferase/squalene synthase [Mycoemilia scoparia]|uniref:Squalene synthase n=1 Tax=Mycoemilia scoparia TaxID=417184 RepID=A0A9W8DVF2_9FUNG|nr:bifunctional farnesyl-diphosphate farnesyltransferase/squalene synthase [Mycoemilia scoparia]
MKNAPASEKTDKMDASSELKQCYDFLTETSRSFAGVIQELNPELRDVICIFYLVLRGLDTVEDDMSIPIVRKKEVLTTFHKSIYERGWTFTESGPDEKDASLLVQFDVVIHEFLNLKEKYQKIIADITKKMGEGMATFTTKDVETTKDYDLYCHYVAGLVGYGLSDLFAASELEDASFYDIKRQSNSMGLFLQKTNIIRDINEDILDGRYFWPKQIWSEYFDNIDDIIKEENREKGMIVLNKMWANALTHIPDVLDYLSRIKNPTIFKFCAIPQVMAIATMAICFNNPDVLAKNVKIRKGEAIKLILNTTDNANVCRTFLKYVGQIKGKNDPSDPNYESIRESLEKAENTIAEELVNLPVPVSTSFIILAIFFGGLSLYFGNMLRHYV